MKSSNNLWTQCIFNQFGRNTELLSSSQVYIKLICQNEEHTIYEESYFSKNYARTGVSLFNKKALYFLISPHLQQYDVDVEVKVFRQISQEGFDQPRDIYIGNVIVPFECLLNDLANKNINGNKIPLEDEMENNYPINSRRGKCLGHIRLNIKASHFGKRAIIYLKVDPKDVDSANEILHHSHAWSTEDSTKRKDYSTIEGGTGNQYGKETAIVDK
ncbi:hypothetical protein C0J52_05253 [Blattella germanica]|nr:hypothetical protein C0J52_05253 [Blattella germanica]